MFSRKLAILLATLTVINAHADIKLGQTADITGKNKAMGVAYSTGANAYFKWINANGGVRGEKITLVTLDDQSDQERGFNNALKLLNDHKVDALFGVSGDNVTYAVATLADARGILNFAPDSGLPYWEQIETNQNMVMTRSGYKQEIETMLDAMSHGKPSTMKGRAVFVAFDGGYASMDLLPTMKSKAGAEIPDPNGYIAKSIAQLGAKMYPLDLRGRTGVADAVKIINQTINVSKDIEDRLVPNIIYISDIEKTLELNNQLKQALSYTPPYQFMLSSVNIGRLAANKNQSISITYTCPGLMEPGKLKGSISQAWSSTTPPNMTPRSADMCRYMQGFLAAHWFVEAYKLTGSTKSSAIKQVMPRVVSNEISNRVMKFTQDDGKFYLAYADTGFVR